MMYIKDNTENIVYNKKKNLNIAYNKNLNIVYNKSLKKKISEDCFSISIFIFN
jgi:hypothetical protein